MSLVTPQEVLDFWIGACTEDPSALEPHNKLWFIKSDITDAGIADRFLKTIEALACGQASDWADTGPHGRLAAIIVLDQFSRNVFRGQPAAFENDALALDLARTGLALGEDAGLAEVERVFFYLPFEHSEDAADQALSVEVFERVVQEARPAFRAYAENTLDYARRHKAVIDRFGRFPHRNAILGRANTSEEAAYLAEPGSGF